MIYNFERLISKYSVQDAFLTAKTEGYWDDDGMWQEGSDESIPLQCAIIPMATKDVYASGGRYTTADRQLYTQQQLKTKQTIEYKKITYTVMEETDYTAYGDFFVYVIRAVSEIATSQSNP